MGVLPPMPTRWSEKTGPLWPPPSNAMCAPTACRGRRPRRSPPTSSIPKRRSPRRRRTPSGPERSISRPPMQPNRTEAPMRHHKQPPASPISFVANVARMPQKGLPVVIEADEKQREALAEAHGLRAVKSLRAELMVTAWRRNGVRVAGTVVADIVQTCVVSLEPVENHIEEEVQGLFLPEDSKLGRLGFDGGGEIMLDVEGPDSPET